MGLYTLNDIKQELIKPGRDPRDQFAVPTFREDVKEVGDLKEDMVLEGTVTNVTNFGAFVDIGVHQDGLVHVSELSNRFVKDPREAVHVGEVVKVKVIGVDVAMKRISLSMKALLPKLKRIKPGKAQKSIRHNQTPVKAAEAVAAAKHTAPAEAAAAKKDQPVKFQQSKPKPASKPEVKAQPKKDAPPPQKKKPEVSPQPVLSLADKIRLLQEKFSGIR